MEDCHDYGPILWILAPASTLVIAGIYFVLEKYSRQTRDDGELNPVKVDHDIKKGIDAEEVHIDMSAKDTDQESKKTVTERADTSGSQTEEGRSFKDIKVKFETERETLTSQLKEAKEEKGTLEERCKELTQKLESTKQSLVSQRIENSVGREKLQSELKENQKLVKELQDKVDELEYKLELSDLKISGEKEGKIADNVGDNEQLIEKIRHEQVTTKETVEKIAETVEVNKQLIQEVRNEQVATRREVDTIADNVDNEKQLIEKVRHEQKTTKKKVQKIAKAVDGIQRLMNEVRNKQDKLKVLVFCFVGFIIIPMVIIVPLLYNHPEVQNETVERNVVEKIAENVQENTHSFKKVRDEQAATKEKVDKIAGTVEDNKHLIQEVLHEQAETKKKAEETNAKTLTEFDRKAEKVLKNIEEKVDEINNNLWKEFDKKTDDVLRNIEEKVADGKLRTLKYHRYYLESQLLKAKYRMLSLEEQHNNNENEITRLLLAMKQTCLSDLVKEKALVSELQNEISKLERTSKQLQLHENVCKDDLSKCFKKRTRLLSELEAAKEEIATLEMRYWNGSLLISAEHGKKDGTNQDTAGCRIVIVAREWWPLFTSVSLCLTVQGMAKLLAEANYSVFVIVDRASNEEIQDAATHSITLLSLSKVGKNVQFSKIRSECYCSYTNCAFFHLHNISNVCAIVGFIDDSDFEIASFALEIKNTLFAKALFLPILSSTPVYDTLAANLEYNDIANYIEAANFLVSVGPRVFSHFNVTLRDDGRSPEHTCKMLSNFDPLPKHIAILPYIYNRTLNIKTEPKPVKDNIHILIFSNDDDTRQSVNVVVRSLGLVANRFDTSQNSKLIKLKIRGIKSNVTVIENLNNIARSRKLEIVTESFPKNKDLLKTIEDDFGRSHLMLHGPKHDPFGTISLYAGAAGFPSLTTEHSGFAKYVSKNHFRFKDKMIVTNLGVTDNEEQNAEEWAKEIIPILSDQNQYNERVEMMSKFQKELREEIMHGEIGKSEQAFLNLLKKTLERMWCQ